MVLDKVIAHPGGYGFYINFEDGEHHPLFRWWRYRKACNLYKATIKDLFSDPKLLVDGAKLKVRIFPNPTGLIMSVSNIDLTAFYDKVESPQSFANAVAKSYMLGENNGER